MRGRRNRLQPTMRVLDEAGLEQQIFRRVTGDGQFGKGHKVDLGPACFLDPCLNQARVPTDISDCRINLGHRNPKGPHQFSPSLDNSEMPEFPNKMLDTVVDPPHGETRISVVSRRVRWSFESASTKLAAVFGMWLKKKVL